MGALDPISIPAWAALLDYRLPGTANDQHWIPVSGGGDSTALAVLMHIMFPETQFRMLFTDTLAEEPEIYTTLDRLEQYLGRPIVRITPEKGLYDLIDEYSGFLPSPRDRWCTRMLKLEPWEKFLKEEQGADQTIHVYVGIRADESSRIAFTHSEIETQMPFVDMGLKREEILRILRESVGIPKFYERRSRSGCSACPFQRTSETIGLMQAQPKEFDKALSYEKLSDADVKRHPDNAVPAWEETGLAVNHQTFPVPIRITDPGRPSIPWGKVKRFNGTDSLFGKVGLFAAYELYVHPSVGGTGVWWKNFITYSTSLAGIRKQLDAFWRHRLATAEVKHMTEDCIREELKLVIAFIEAPGDLVDVGKIGAESFTWHQGKSYAQIKHLVGWAKRSLHIEGLRQEAERLAYAADKPTSWAYEQRIAMLTALDRVEQETGEVLLYDLYEPKESVDPDDETDERLIACPMCQI